ncbi:MAG: trypsin-like peptidase domain-containing protein [Ruminococcus sp.]|nr:trypsin-like peptidase domain-containing protein [Ruminococcus sp.]
MIISQKTKTKKIFGVLFAIVMLLSVMFTTVAQVSANSETVEEVNAVKECVVKVRVVYFDGNANSSKEIAYATGFFISNDTLLTSAHLFNDVTIDDAKYAWRSSKVSNEPFNKDNIKYQVVVPGNTAIEASVIKTFDAFDVSVVKIKESYTSELAVLGDSAPYTSTAEVFALGFPAVKERLQTVQYNNQDNVTVSKGTVESVETKSLFGNTTAELIAHSAKITSGNSGGPLVNSKGEVIGINAYADRLTGQYYYAISINQVKEQLEKFQYDYQSSSGSVIDSDDNEGAEVEPTEAESETTEVATVPTVATAPVNDEADSSTDLTQIIIIAAIAVLVIVLVIVVIIIILNSKKKKSPVPVQAKPTTQSPVVNRPVPPVGQSVPPTPQPFAPRTMGGSQTVMNNDGAGETSVLNEGAGETTVLGYQATGGSLVRKSNGDRVVINKPEFVIGKERRRVDYCISNNNSISRTHARIRVRAGKCYISDLGATNFTFVNGNKLVPNQEVALNKGDIVKLSDEEFEFLG